VRRPRASGLPDTASKTEPDSVRLRYSQEERRTRATGAESAFSRSGSVRALAPARHGRRRGIGSLVETRPHDGRPGVCTFSAGKPRSTPKRACFTTCPATALTCAAREVTFYLALPSPLSPRAPSRAHHLPRLDSAPTLRGAPSGSAAAPPGSPNQRPDCDDPSPCHDPSPDIVSTSR
jgi:hypothetical protein